MNAFVGVMATLAAHGVICAVWIALETRERVEDVLYRVTWALRDDDEVAP